MATSDNAMDLSQFKGPVVPCPFCPPVIDSLTSRAACTKCMGQKFISLCLNCDHTGQFKGRTVWDGGANTHVSTCTPCGGNGFFPSRGPATARYIPPTKPGEPATTEPLDSAPVQSPPGTAEMPLNAPDGAHVVDTPVPSMQ